MANLVREIDRLPKLTKGQRAFRDDMILQASLQVTGAVSDCLHHIDADEALREWATEIGHRALRKYASRGEQIDGNWLEGLTHAPGAVEAGRHFEEAPIQSAVHISYGERWLRLLEGDFVPLPLQSSGKFHATGEIEIDLVRPEKNLRSLKADVEFPNYLISASGSKRKLVQYVMNAILTPGCIFSGNVGSVFMTNSWSPKHPIV